VDLFAQDAPPPPHARPGPGGWTYLRVAVERGLDQGGRGEGLTYKSGVPVEVGRRVEVPLGRGDARAAGIVIAAGGPELLDGFSPAKVKPILKDTGAGLPPRLVELAKWMSGYYVCPLGMTLAAMLPAAVKKRTGLRTVTYLERAGAADVAQVLEGGMAADGRGVDADQDGESGRVKITPKVRAVWEAVAGLPSEAFPMTPDALAARLESRTLAPVNRLVKLGLLRRIDVEDVRQRGGVETQMGIEQADPLGGAALLPNAARPTPTPAQQGVIDGISGALGRFGVHLLHGVTGSGKTEVYLRVLERVLERGGSALVLVPEISLTPQTAGRFVERFRSAGVAVLHSGLSASQRHKEWTRAAGGGARVVVGARSAVFAPLERLGLIVVDEEHAPDYKQDQLPRYHGRDVAIKRAHMEGCPVVLGSATPSLESWANAVPPPPPAERFRPMAEDERAPRPAPPPARPKYQLWTLHDRVGGGRLPRVEIVDLAEERRLRQRTTGKRDAHVHLIGPTLERALAETLLAGGQALLLLNRRGYASYIACTDPNCGWVMTCDDCDVKMVQHRVVAGRAPPKGLVRCHHCLAQKLLPERCPQCTGKLIALATGTQGVEEELARKFGHLLGAPHAPAGGARPIPPSGPSAPPRSNPTRLERGGAEFAERTQSGGAVVDGVGPSPLPPRPPAPLPTDAPADHATPHAPLPGLLRIDGDTMGSAKDYFDALSRFARGEIRVLLGTQMIAKGLDFPNVRLVGVINADTALSLPDFRAAERTFGLVSQVAGRAGRGAAGGRVIVQTFDPSAAAITFAARHDFDGFARAELRVREEHGLPPCARMARIVLRDLDLAKATAAADRLAAELRAAAGTRGVGNVLRITGPMPCPIARIAAHHRLAIELVCPGRTVIQDVLADVRAKGLLKSDAHTAVDIDPIALM
jgi:primosomal protein N' (replication factor Y)